MANNRPKQYTKTKSARMSEDLFNRINTYLNGIDEDFSEVTRTLWEQFLPQGTESTEDDNQLELDL